jgi:hypothetical protein
MALRLGHGILAMVLAVMATACGSDSQATRTTIPPSANVSGVVLAGPTCPVVTRERPCPPQPVDTEIAAQNTAGETVAHTRTDADGQYSLALAPGVYTLVAATLPGGPMSCDPVSVTVSAGPGPAVHADISCDTGIR